MRTIILLTVSNVFMTLAWYGHLKYKDTPLWIAILASWGIAFVEYCFQVPANRIGHYDFTAAQLKTIQEVITLAVFCVFSVLYLREPLKWNYLLGFGMVICIHPVHRGGQLVLRTPGRCRVVPVRIVNFARRLRCAPLFESGPSFASLFSWDFR